MSAIADRVAALRAAFESGITKPIAWRTEQLRALRRLLVERGDELEAALYADLRKSPAESQLTELGLAIREIDDTLAHLRRWLRPKRIRVPLLVQPASGRIVREPLGLVLVIAPWNYPAQLLLVPLIGALAAGNAVVVKPSELAPATSAAFARLLPQYLDARAVAVVEGGVPQATELLAERYDRIFFTGSGHIGRVVLLAAAKHLTPVTLELGGKSPAYLDDTVDLRAAARRLAWSKYMNAGQTCVAPDFVLTTRALQERLVPLLEDAIAEYYGTDPARSASYGRIVNDAQFARLVGLLDGQDVALGGHAEAGARYLAPTVLRDVSLESPVMRDEIFGPILPIVPVDGLDEAIRVVQSRDKPLAVYAFTTSARARRMLTTRTSSGALVFGAPSTHLMIPEAPFGGVGASGMGAYHGERSVIEFSHEKTVLSKPLRPDTLDLVYPPFTPARESRIRRLLRLRG